jgi:hypothetical protein
MFFELSATGDTNSYQGDGVSGAYIWGAQINVGYGAMPYISTTSAPTGPIYCTFLMSALSNAYHSIVLTVTAAGSAGITIAGMEANINVPGVRVHRIPLSGATYLGYTGIDAPSWEASMQALKPHVVVIQLGVNELLTNVTPAAQVAGYATLASRIHAVLPMADILIVSPIDIGATGTYTMAQYAAAQQAAAQANGWAYVDAYTQAGSYASTAALGLWTNTTHVNAYGGQMIANYVLSAIRRGP